MARTLRAAHASPNSIGARKLTEARLNKTAAWLSACEQLGETSARGHARGAVMPGCEALDVYARLFGLGAGDFLDRETLRRHERAAAKVAAEASP